MIQNLHENNALVEDVYAINCLIDVRIFFTDFRTWTNFQVSNDELQHICWHVRSCEEETVNPILRALYYPNRVGTRPISPTSNSFEDDLQLMQTWKEDTVSETFCSGSKDVSMQETMDDEVTRMDPDSAEVHLIVTASSPNQMIQLCLALEEAGKAVAELHRPVYLQLAKTFFKSKIFYLVFTLESGKIYVAICI